MVCGNFYLNEFYTDTYYTTIMVMKLLGFQEKLSALWATFWPCVFTIFCIKLVPLKPNVANQGDHRN